MFDESKIRQDIKNILAEYVDEFNQTIQLVFCRAHAAIDCILIEFYCKQGDQFDKDRDSAYTAFAKYRTKLMSFLEVVFPDSNISYNNSNGHAPHKYFWDVKDAVNGSQLLISNIPMNLNPNYDICAYQGKFIDDYEAI